jgi:biotin carboxylase
VTAAGPAGPRVLLLVPARTYRAADFLLAAAIAERMGLPHNSAEAIRNATDKAGKPQRWAAAGVPQPRFEVILAAAPAGAIRRAAETVGFPCVVKAVSLSASQGILRADDADAAVTVATRIRRVLAAARRPGREPLLIEEYLPGPEISIDGLLASDGLAVTAIFDKPATPDGPTFEETLLVTPSRLPAPVQAAATATAGQAARALGLTHGPVHAELRIDVRGSQPRPAMLELAARSIGGLCSRVLRFPGGQTLEELILATALGRPVPAASHAPDQAAGVYVLPVPHAGLLRAIEGRDRAAAVPGITGLTITIPAGQQVRPLPDGDRYLGFIFAAAATPHEVEQVLTTARGQLRVTIQ